MIKLLKQILSFESINLLITSRKEQDIITELQPHVEVVKCIESARVYDDIYLYIHKCLDNDPTLKRCRPVREEVIKILVEGANGMYVSIITLINELKVPMGCMSVRCSPKMSYTERDKDNPTPTTQRLR
jgi:hypothetical protein